MILKIFIWAFQLAGWLVLATALWVVYKISTWFLCTFVAPLLPERRYHKRSYGRPHTTARGEVVKSRGEKIIADYLFSHGFDYQYEPLMQVGGETVRPDFALPDEKVIIEFFGVTGDEEYRIKNNYKRSLYDRHNANYIAIYPKDLNNLDERILFELRPPVRVLD